jgi:hypothetical protein
MIVTRRAAAVASAASADAAEATVDKQKLDAQDEKEAPDSYGCVQLVINYESLQILLGLLTFFMHLKK